MTKNKDIQSYIDNTNNLIKVLARNNLLIDAQKFKADFPPVEDNMVSVYCDEPSNEQELEVINKIFELSDKTVLLVNNEDTVYSSLSKSLPANRIKKLHCNKYEIALYSDIYLYLHDSETYDIVTEAGKLFVNINPLTSPECTFVDGYANLIRTWSDEQKIRYYGEASLTINDPVELIRHIFSDYCDASSLDALIESKATGINKYYLLIRIGIIDKGYRERVCYFHCIHNRANNSSANSIEEPKRSDFIFCTDSFLKMIS